MIGYSVGNGTQHIYKDSLGRIYVNAYIDGTLTNASGSRKKDLKVANDRLFSWKWNSAYI